MYRDAECTVVTGATAFYAPSGCYVVDDARGSVAPVCGSTFAVRYYTSPDCSGAASSVPDELAPFMPKVGSCSAVDGRAYKFTCASGAAPAPPLNGALSADLKSGAVCTAGQAPNPSTFNMYTHSPVGQCVNNVQATCSAGAGFTYTTYGAGYTNCVLTDPKNNAKTDAPFAGGCVQPAQADGAFGYNRCVSPVQPAAQQKIAAAFSNSRQVVSGAGTHAAAAAAQLLAAAAVVAAARRHA